MLFRRSFQEACFKAKMSEVIAHLLDESFVMTELPLSLYRESKNVVISGLHPTTNNGPEKCISRLFFVCTAVDSAKCFVRRQILKILGLPLLTS